MYDASLCGVIAPGQSCAVPFTTEAMNSGGHNSALFTVNYHLSKNSSVKTTNQILNYQYMSTASMNGVGFTSDLRLISPQGGERFMVGYLFAGQSITADHNTYNNVVLKNSNSNISVYSGFQNGSQVAVGEVVPVEIKVSQAFSVSNVAVLTPTWSVGAGLYSGNPLSVSLTPSANMPNLLVGSIPIVALPESNPMTVYLVNNGTAATSGGITASATGSLAGNVQITNNCSGVSLNPNATNSCSFDFNVTGNQPGSATITFSYNGVAFSTQTLLATNATPYPIIVATPSPSTISITAPSTSPLVTFTVSNLGNESYNFSGVVANNTNPSAATWTQSSNTCSGVLSPSATCQVTGTFTAPSNAQGFGSLYLIFSGTSAGTGQSYSFASGAVTFYASADVLLSINPLSNAMNIIANSVDVSTESYVLTNSSSNDAQINNIYINNLTANPLVPVIGSNTCGAVLAAGASCNVTVSFGPSSTTTSESGNAQLVVNYNPVSYQVPMTLVSAISYSVTGNSSYTTISAPNSSTMSGNGTSSTPFIAYSITSNPTYNIVFTNSSTTLPMNNFNVNTNSLPLGLTVGVPSSGTACPTASSTATLAPSESCVLAIMVSPSVLNNAGGSLALNQLGGFVATWNNSFGFYSQTSNPVYLTYNQPTVTSTLSVNNSYFATTTLNIVATNLNGATLNYQATPLAGVFNTAPTTSAPCSVGASPNYAVTCSLSSSTSTGSIVYTPNTYGMAQNILLNLSILSGYAYLSSNWLSINWQPGP